MDNNNDLLEDQKIHYIVKDYQRMFNVHNELVKACKEAAKALDEKDKKIKHLKTQAGKCVSVQKVKYLKAQLRLISDQLNSSKSHADKGLALMDDLLASLETVDTEDDVFPSPSETAQEKRISYLEFMKKSFRDIF